MHFLLVNSFNSCNCFASLLQCAEVHQHVNILIRELKGVELSPDAMDSINRLLAIGNTKM